MRKLSLAVVLASTAMASPSLAKDKSWYIGGEVGPSIAEVATSSYSNAVTATTPHKVGYDAAATFGYDFGGFPSRSRIFAQEVGQQEFVLQRCADG